VESRGNFEKWRIGATLKSGGRDNFEKWRVGATLKSEE